MLALMTSLVLAVMHPAEDGEALLRRMNAVHRDTWFRTMIFVQKTSYPGSDRPEETWYETMSRPGRLRIDIERDGEIAGRMLFRSDSVYQFVGDRRHAQPQVHYLLLVAHDIHVGDPDAIIGKLRALGYDLSKTGKATYQGRDVVTVGAVTGDTTSRQFWVDPERLIAVRFLQTNPNGAVSDVQVGGFTSQGPAVVEGTITFLTNGRPGMVEEYTWIRTGVEIPEILFDPEHDAPPAWIAEYRRGASGG